MVLGKDMLRVLAERCTDVLINHETIQKDKKNIYIYGFELFWSTTFCVLSILALSILLGYFKLAVTFLLFSCPYVLRQGDIMQNLMADVLFLLIR